MYVGRSNGTWVQLDSDGIIIGRITDKTKPIRIKAVKDGVDKQLADAIAFADAQPFAPEESAVVDVYSDIDAEVRER